MEIIIDDKRGLLTKTQKTKIRRYVISVWKDEESFYDETDNVLAMIHYNPDTTEKYNFMRFRLETPSRLVLEPAVVKQISPEEKREELRKRLRQKINDTRNIQQKGGRDPKWKAYQDLRSRLPQAAATVVPDPDQVMASPDTYRSMMTMIPNQNPLYQYLSLFNL